MARRTGIATAGHTDPNGLCLGHRECAIASQSGLTISLALGPAVSPTYETEFVRPGTQIEAMKVESHIDAAPDALD